MPDIFFGMFFLVFFLILGMILFTLIKGIGQWNKNNHSPRLTVEARVVAKRGDVSHYHHQDANGIGHTSSSTSSPFSFKVDPVSTMSTMTSDSPTSGPSSTEPFSLMMSTV